MMKALFTLYNILIRFLRILLAIEIALAVTKRALLTDDDDNDGHHVIAIAHFKTKTTIYFCQFGRSANLGAVPNLRDVKRPQ
jgi:hypothetical protein